MVHSASAAPSPYLPSSLVTSPVASGAAAVHQDQRVHDNEFNELHNTSITAHNSTSVNYSNNNNDSFSRSM